jgi:hypothetical protein
MLGGFLMISEGVAIRAGALLVYACVSGYSKLEVAGVNRVQVTEDCECDSI